ncbi:MFS transporter, partial [Streptomyces sp. NPDC029216]|uniref:MFS transporter n=1 Tax=Streptomyces sp. NPDC029216 TaxID=3154701 RepID=UPI0033C7BF57
MTPLGPHPAAPPAPPAQPARRVLLAGAAGNFVEWYEFGVYGCFATVLATRFFTPAPGTGPAGPGPLLAAYASFAVAFFLRPAGALLFGRLGDRVGRRPTLILVVGLMTLATTLIGLLPTRETAGAAAPWLLTLLRALQGLSAGGEFGGAVALMTEQAPPGRRGRHGAWQSFTVALGLLAGAGTSALLAALLPPQALTAWGWRIPFLLALPLGLTALTLRKNLPEPTGHPTLPRAPAACRPTRLRAATAATASPHHARRERADPLPATSGPAPGAACPDTDGTPSNPRPGDPAPGAGWAPGAVPGAVVGAAPGTSPA